MSRAAGRYRGRRRARFITFAFSSHPEITVVAVLLVAVGVTMALRTVGAVGSSAPTTTRAEGPAASPAPRGPIIVPGELPPTARSSTGTSAKATPSPTGPQAKEPVGVIPPTSSPVPVPSQALISYEAEAPEAVRSPGMAVRSLPIASSGRYVGNVGRGNSVVFTNVAAEGAGEYILTIYYLSAEIRTAQLRINGGPPQLLTFAPSGGWEVVAPIALRVQLLVGLNSVELGNPPDQPSPDLDRITLQG